MLYYLSERDGICCRLGPSRSIRARKSRTAPPASSIAPRRSPLELNYPPGNGKIDVGRDKIAIWRGVSTGNVYMAKPKGK